MENIIENDTIDLEGDEVETKPAPIEDSPSIKKLREKITEQRRVEIRIWGNSFKEPLQS